MRTLTVILSDARVRYETEAIRGPEWTLMHMSQTERDAFDRWLVKVNHVLASEAGTQESRFLRFVRDWCSGRYKGEMP